MELPSVVRVNTSPTILAVILQARQMWAEIGRKTQAASLTVTLVAQLVVDHVRLDLELNTVSD